VAEGRVAGPGGIAIPAAVPVRAIISGQPVRRDDLLVRGSPRQLVESLACPAAVGEARAEKAVREKFRLLRTAVSALPYRLAGILLRDTICRRLAAAADRAYRQGHYARAVRCYREALELAERYGADDRWWAGAYTGLALAYSRLGKYIEAEALHRRALEIYEKAQPLEQPRMADCLSNLGALSYHQGRYAEAKLFYQRALTIQEAVLGPTHPEVAADLSNLGAICDQQHRYDEAESLLRRALTIQEEALGVDHPDVATTLNNLAFLYQEQGRAAEAEALLRRALTVMQGARGPAHPETAVYINNLALLCAEQGRDEAAEPLYRQALSIRRKSLGPAHPDVATSLENYAALLHTTLRSEDAERLSAQAKAIRARHAEELLTRRWSALPVSADRSAREDLPDWVARLSAAAAIPAEGGEWRIPGPPVRLAHASSDRFKPGASAALGEVEPASPRPVEGRSPRLDLGIEDDLQRALDRNELQVYYQPIFSLAAGQITGAEALIRWQHVRHGLLSPKEFVPLAEETGLILSIGEWLLREACAQRTAWSEAGHSNVRLFVNLSRREFQEERLPERIREVLRATGMTPSALQLEITERVALQDVPSSVKTLERLAETGIQVALDDAGSDPSLLLHLRQLPVQAVKLDGSLVRRMATDPNAASLVEEITSLAHSLDRMVIALGVETEEQLALVREHRCDEVQGYLFRRAAPAELFTLLLQEGPPLPMGSRSEARRAGRPVGNPVGPVVERTLP
jgi:EAL domain-containing protein (putative c-di-GMP-specific phosphodiesterase class I)/tetratricopeptide (TPR) repeat protein